MEYNIKLKKFIKDKMSDLNGCEYLPGYTAFQLIYSEIERLEELAKKDLPTELGIKLSKISKEDVLYIANTVFVKYNFNDIDIDKVVESYEFEQKQDPTASWDLIIENLLYGYIQ